MKHSKLREQLSNMVNKTYNYGGSIHCVLSVSVNDEKANATINTNVKSFTKPVEAFDEFLGYWVLHENVNQIAVFTPQANNIIQVFAEEEKSTFSKMTDILLNNIEKVQADEKYIPQAVAINKNVDSIIAVQRLKLDVISRMKLK